MHLRKDELGRVEIVGDSYSTSLRRYKNPDEALLAGEEMGSIWGSIKSIGSRALGVAKQVGIYAIPGYGQYRLLKDVKSGMLSMASYPIWKKVEPQMNKLATTIAKKKGRTTPNKADKELASKSFMDAMHNSGNRLVRLGATILHAAGRTGISGMAGASIPVHPSEVGITDMGFEPITLSVGTLALAGAAALAVGAAVHALMASASQTANAPDAEQPPMPYPPYQPSQGEGYPSPYPPQSSYQQQSYAPQYAPPGDEEFE